VERQYGEVPDIHCNLGQLNQVFRILLKNAADAIEADGTITISTELRDERVHIRFSDIGRGIPADRLDRLFDFGFTKGASRVRLSSGLPTAYNIMEQHHGEIRLESRPEEGTTVFLELPAV
jgi:signal transduction histidine kinase